MFGEVQIVLEIPDARWEELMRFGVSQYNAPSMLESIHAS
jgi:hypothetical protein